MNVLRDSRPTDHQTSLDTPLAIVGIGCRLPGGIDSPDAFWSMLMRGECAIDEVPPDRWNLANFYSRNPDAPGKAKTKWGGFVRDIADFDADFFAISPREVEAMDPQQRVLLRVTWEAFEDASIPVHALAGSDTAVFAGVSVNDYSFIQRLGMSTANMHAGSGTALSIVANRISHRFDLRGPSASVDTACSSSLLATHMACQAIWSGESRIAVAAGVNAMFDPGIFVTFSKANMMSPTGRIRTFDAAADGYVRGEGAGAIILKPLDDAIRDHDRIHAVIRATVTNQDGRTSTITVPNPEAQAVMLREACRAAGLDPSEVGFVEAHGTGTPVGDPIEAHAIGTVFGQNRARDDRVVVGAVKANIGHLESAAGIAGLIKAALCVGKGTIPPNVGFERLNPAIDLDALNIELPLVPRPWSDDAGKRRAAVNSFGFGGTNACAIVEQPPTRGAPVPHGRQDRRPFLVPVSAATPSALATSAGRLADHIEGEGRKAPDLRDIAATLSRRRSHLGHRAVIIARSRQELVRRLRAVASGDVASENGTDVPAAITVGRAREGQRIAFAFSGQGGQWFGMGRDLLARDPVFRKEVERVDTCMREVAGWSPIEEIGKRRADSRIDETRYTQGCVFAIQVGLAARWRAWGIEPDMVFGHSLGELATALVAGALTLEDAVRCLDLRSRLQAESEGDGAIVAVGMSREAAERHLLEWGESEVEVAAINSASLVSLAGHKDAVARVVRRLQASHGDDLFVRRIRMNFAPHSPMMDPIRERILAGAAALAPRACAIPMISTVTGSRVVGAELDAAYWWRNVRDPVLFQPAVTAAVRQGATVFIEIGPHATLTGLIATCAAETGATVTAIASQKRGHKGIDALHAALARAHVEGVPVAWDRVVRGAYNFVRLPGYPWETKRCWAHSEEQHRFLHEHGGHPLLAERQNTAAPSWRAEIGIGLLPWLADHVVDGHLVVPGTLFIEAMLGAGRTLFGDGPMELVDVEIHEALFLSRERTEFIETSYDHDRRRLAVHSRPRGSEEWTLRASATLIARPLSEPAALEWGAARETARAYKRKKVYDTFAALGYEYGPAFQGIRELRTNRRSILSRRGQIWLDVAVPRDLDAERGWVAHPAFLDSCTQGGIGLVGDFDDPALGQAPVMFLPTRVDRIRFHRVPDLKARTINRPVSVSRHRIVTDTIIADRKGRVAIEWLGVHAVQIPRRGRPAEGGAALGYYEETWTETPTPAAEADDDPGRWLVLADEGGLGARIARRLRRRGADVRLTRRGDRYRAPGRQAGLVDPESPDHFGRLVADMTADGETLSGIVFAWGLDAVCGRRAGSRALAEAERLGLVPALHLAQALAGDDAPAPRIWLVTAGARTVPEAHGAGAGIALAPLAGFARTSLTERPALRWTVVDLDPAMPAEDQDAELFAELAQDDDEREMAWRDGRRYVNRVVPVEEAALPPRQAPVTDGEDFRPFRVTMSAPGDLGNLTLAECENGAPGPGEVAIDVESVGLNFRDVMAATGLLPAEAEDVLAWDALGLECAGRIRAVGADVRGVRSGDLVMATARGSLRSTVVVPAAAVHRVPRGLDAAQATTIPSAFVTAHFALARCARLQPGERVLIHLGTGGVGLAAVQIARMLGAEVLATAGSPRKRDYLRKLGIRHVMDSRSLDFADEVMTRTRGRGVDVVLNALSGAAIEKGLSVLAPCGRFVEIGKRDVYADSPIGMRALRRNIALYVVDMARMGEDDPAAVKETFAALGKLFASGRLQPLPVERFPVGRVADAFRHMAAAGHIGKVVVDMRDPSAKVAVTADRPLTFREDGAYLVTGGLGGFGFEIAKWMARHGAGHLYLMGRSGASGDEAKRALRALRRGGVRVTDIAADVSRPRDIADVLARIAADGVALRGIIHAAAVIDDGFIEQLDASRMRAVLRPKANGAWNLHNATRRVPLDFFVMFSSVASVLGSRGQANYVAANAFLDELAQLRRSAGLPALAINWGALGGAGFVERNQAMIDYMESMGMPPVPLGDSLNALGRLLRTDAPRVAYLNVDWAKLSRTNPDIERSPRFRAMTATRGEKAGRIRQEILDAGEAQRPAVVARYLTEQVARVLKTDRGKIRPDLPLAELGLDSLTSFQLKNRVEAELALSLPVGRFLQKPTIEGLAGVILEALSQTVDHGQDAELATASGEAPRPSIRQEWLVRKYVERPERDARLRDYEMAYAVTLRPRPDLERLQTAFAEAVAARPAVRMQFPVEDGEVLVRIAPPDQVPFEILDASRLEEAAFRRILQREASAPFDLANGPLFGLKIYLRPDDSMVMLIRVHHLVSDGWSFIQFVAEMFARYFGLFAGEPGGPDYLDYARWQRAMIEGSQGRRQREFWRQRLADAGPELPLPYDRPPTGHVHLHGGYRKFVLGADVSRRVDALARRLHTTAYTVLLGAFNATLHALTGVGDLPVTAAVAGRTRPEFEAVHGWFANEVVFRGRLDPASRFDGTLRELDGVLTAALENQDYPFNLVLDDIRAANGGTGALDQVGFYMWAPNNFEDYGLGLILLGVPGVRVSLLEFEIETVELDVDDARRELTLYVQQNDGEIHGSLNFDADVFDGATADRIVALYAAILRRAVEQPGTPIGDLAAMRVDAEAAGDHG